MSKEILLIPHNHFDPTWRRCFDRPAVYNKTIVRSYAEVEELCINNWLKLTSHDYPFSEGQVAIWRKYLERNPAKKARIQAEAKAGTLDILRAGEVVPDTVMSTAEGLVRNFLVAEPFYRDLVGKDHPALKLGWLEDAFGNSPNYPQVLKGVGAEAACYLTYRSCPEPVWVGIDGSKIFCTDQHPASFFGAFAKHAPCPQCRGKGCASCHKTGMLLVPGFDISALRKTIADAITRKEKWLAIRILTEEVLPDPQLVNLIKELNRKYRGKARIRFGNFSEVYRRYLPTLQAALQKRDDKPTVDLNPAMPGCMVSRIKLKQRTRASSYHLIAAEAALANASWRRNKPVPQPKAITDAWQLVAFNQFHDAITGTHIDSANRELHDMLDKADATAHRYLPLSQKPADTGRFVRVKKAIETKTLGACKVRFDRQGILSILCHGRDLFAIEQPRWNKICRPNRIAELLLEPDNGDPWGQRIAHPSPAGWNDYSVIALGDYHTRVEASATAIRWHGRYTGGDTKVKKLEWTVTVCSSADGQRLDFKTNVNWDTGSRRIRVVIPVASEDPTATYEVPFGFINRTFDASKTTFTAWETNEMEFPTLHWLRKSIDKKCGVALFNKGLPCNRWMPTRMDLSLVRSPEWSFCLVEPGSYEFWDIDGMRDPGRHTFEYSILPYTNRISEGELTRIGYAYNTPAPINLPFQVSGDVVVTAWKPAENGKGWILRLQESGGKGTPLKITFTESRTITKTNLLEDPVGKPSSGKDYQTRIHKHGILTLLIQ